jgi:methylmalonyl-CoA epimerase
MKIDHVGIVVCNIQEALQVKVAFLPVGESNVELVEPTSGGSGIARFLAERGEGIHHICIEVEDIDDTLRQLVAHGVQLIDEQARQGPYGRVAFIHPKGAHGVLIELVEHEH